MIARLFVGIIKYGGREMVTSENWIYISDDDMWLRSDIGGIVKGRDTDMLDPDTVEYVSASKIEELGERAWRYKAERYIRNSRRRKEIINVIERVTGEDVAIDMEYDFTVSEPEPHNHPVSEPDPKDKEIRIREILEDEERRNTIWGRKRIWRREHPVVEKKTRRKRSTHRKLPPDLREEILKRDGYTCQECGSRENLQIHHIKYRSKGGSDDPENLVTLCELCHYRKHKGEPIGRLMAKRLNIKS